MPDPKVMEQVLAEEWSQSVAPNSETRFVWTGNRPLLAAELTDWRKESGTVLEARALYMANALRMARLLREAPERLEVSYCRWLQSGDDCKHCDAIHDLRENITALLRDLGLTPEPAEAV